MSRPTHDFSTTTPPLAMSQPSGPVGLLVRGLIAVGLIVGWVQLAHTPVHRPIEELIWALETNRVTSITIERPPPDSQGAFSVEWDGPGRPAYSSYLHNTDNASFGWDTAEKLGDTEAAVRVDERAEIIALAERAGVAVVERDWAPSSGGFRWELGGIASLAGLLLLIGGPQPRLASKWAWFWLSWPVPVVWLAFVVLEPTPWGRRTPLEPATRRLTGGWAFLLGIVLAGLLTSLPWYREFFPR